jgi:SAM-dependent methyltransferase
MKISAERIEKFLDTVIEEKLFKAKLFSSKEKLRFNLENLFEGIDLRGKKVLDIGGGFGLHSFYVACRGADSVICLEPAIEGSSDFAIEKFQKLHNRLGIKQVTLQTTTFQEFKHDGELFDLVLSHYSINHLDESACITLRENKESQKKYEEMAIKLNSIMKSGAIIIVCDCSSQNFFSHIGIRNPYAPTITWHLHHPPQVWIAILKSAGFVDPKIDWTSFGEFRKIGKLLLGYKSISYFLNSHFCLRMKKL